MHSIWTVQTGHNLGTLQEKVATTINLPVSGADTITKIAGTIPPGLRLSGTTITGSPFQVSRNSTFEFCLRAKHDTRVQDRTFTINVQGPDAPTWVTPAGTLKIGDNNQLFVLDSARIDYQLQAIDADLSANTTLEYYILEGGGSLPPGLSMSSTGRITGVIDPILALDIQSSTGYYDSNDYASSPFDFGIPGAYANQSFYFDIQDYQALYNANAQNRVTRKLNRFYSFTVNVTDGDSVATRTFQIFVVGDDFLRADNTILQVGSGVFTSDGTYLRNPQWLTPADLGFKRANNYVTIFLELYDPSTLSGTINYYLENTNPDGTFSELPEGTTLDSSNGEIAGRVPYQPQITKEYKFTVTAVRAGTGVDFVTVNIIPYEDQQHGSDQLKINKLPLGQQDGLDDLNSLLQEKIKINDVEYTVIGVNGANANYDVLTLNQTMTATDLKVYTGNVYNPSTYKTAPTLINRANNEIFVFNRISKDKYKNRIIKIGNNEYKIEDIQTVLNEGEPALQNITTMTAMEKLVLNVPLTDSFVNEQNISIAAFKGVTYTKDFLLSSTDTEPKATKTFTVKMLGEVDSTITWSSATALGTIKANLMSHLRVTATSTVPDARLKYILINGTLPPGLALTINGEIIGKVRLNPDGTLPGVTAFDSRGFTFDGGTTTVDANYSFTVRAQDRFGFSSVERTFTINTTIGGAEEYTNLYVQPLLKESQRSYFKDFISNSNIFDPDKIYRPTDKDFGLQKNLRMLLYAGIEKKTVANYVTAVASNHKRRRFNFGEIKTAVANFEGTTTAAYEVVYATIVDPKDSTTKQTASSIKIAQPQNKVRVNQTQLEVTDDVTKLNVGGSTYSIFVREGSAVNIGAVGNDLEILARTGRLLINVPNGELFVDMVSGPDLLVGSVAESPADPFRFRPKNAVIKVDSNLIKASASDDYTRFISNIGNMRDKVKALGSTEGALLPLWMRTAQSGTLAALGYVSAVPICFCKPGQAESVRLAIKNSTFDIRQINFEIDRYVVEGTTGNKEDQYVLFPDYHYNI